MVFQDFTFISPIIELLEFDCATELPVYKPSNINYGYIVLIFLGIGILLKSSYFGKRFYNLFSNSSQREMVKAVEECVNEYEIDILETDQGYHTTV